jgi:iron(III) transport system substrate-binding protein
MIDPTKRRSLLVGAMVGAVAALTLSAPALAEPSAATLDKLAASARANGPILWYESSPREQADKVIAAFGKRFPGVELQHLRDAGGAGIGGRVIQEVQGGARTADILTGSASVIWQLVNRELVVKQDWASLGVPDTVAHTPYTIASTTAVYVILSNKQMVKDEEAPKNWEDLTDPKWKGRVGLWIRAEPQLSLASVWGEERTMQFIRQMNAQQPFLFKSTFPLAQQVGAGEVPVGVGLYHAAQPPIQKGAPIRVQLTDPVATTTLHSAVIAPGKNRDGGLLLSLWLATTDGARAYEEATGRGHAGVKGTEVQKMLEGRRLAEFSADKVPENLEMFERFNKAIAAGGQEVR